MGLLSSGMLSGTGEAFVTKIEMWRVEKAVKRMVETVENKATVKALAEVGKFGRNKVKESIPSRYKSVRKAIAWRHLKKKYSGGQRGIKVGGGVGPNLLRRKRLTEKQQIRADKIREKIATTHKNRKDKKRPGVGIDKANVHWWFFGTDKRTTGTKRVRVKGAWTRVDTGMPKMNRGRMPPQSKPIRVILASNATGIVNIVRTHMSTAIAVEARKNT
jgi:hypothetical protein